MIAIGCDQAAFEYKQKVMEHLDEKGITFKDFGTFSSESCDYPVYAKEVSNAVVSGKYERGILICGTGIGMSIAANKVKGIRAAVCHTEYEAEKTRQHNDANIICLGARVLGIDQVLACIDVFLSTEFSNAERHARRVKMLED